MVEHIVGTIAVGPHLIRKPGYFSTSMEYSGYTVESFVKKCLTYHFEEETYVCH